MTEETESQNYFDPPAVVQRLGLVPSQKVGDFGVGGAAPFALVLSAAVGADGQVLMFDVMKSALSGALTLTKLRGATNCQAVWSNLEIYGGASGVADGSLDAGILVNVLDQSTKQKDILAEVGRMLRSGAKLLVVDWKPDVELPIAPDPAKRVADGQVEQLAKELGFALLEKFEAGPYHWGVVLVKT